MLVLPRGLAEDLKRHATSSLPRECCGALLGTRDGGRKRVARVLEARNIARAPEVEYVMHPDDLLRALREAETGNGGGLLGFYHSHPFGPRGPSRTDAARAAWDGFSYVIYCLRPEGLGSWVWDGARKAFAAEPVVVED